MPDQARVRADLECAKAARLLGTLEPLLHMPAAKGNSQHVLHRRIGGGVAHKVFDFACRRLARIDQPIRAIGRLRNGSLLISVLHQVYPRGLPLPRPFAAP